MRFVLQIWSNCCSCSILSETYGSNGVTPIVPSFTELPVLPQVTVVVEPLDSVFYSILITTVSLPNLASEGMHS